MVENIVTKAVENSIKEICDFKTWWQKDFPRDLYYDSEEELKSFSEDDLKIVQADWIFYEREAVVEVACEKLGIDLYDIKNNEHQELVEEIFEIASEKLWEAMRTEWK